MIRVCHYCTVIPLSGKEIKDDGSIDLDFIPELLFVCVTASWCGHCKRLKPVMAKLANVIDVGNIEDDKEFYARSSAYETTPFRNKYNKQTIVRGYPTIVLYKNGMFHNGYSGQREFGAMYEWATETLNKY